MEEVEDGGEIACVRRSHAIVRVRLRERGGGVGRIAEVGSRIKRTGRHRPPPPPTVNSYGLTAGLKGSHLHYLSFF